MQGKGGEIQGATACETGSVVESSLPPRPGKSTAGSADGADFCERPSCGDERLSTGAAIGGIVLME